MGEAVLVYLRNTFCFGQQAGVGHVNVLPDSVSFSSGHKHFASSCCCLLTHVTYCVTSATGVGVCPKDTYQYVLSVWPLR